MRLYSSAKINLCLHVTGKREDGYHELVMLMSRISIMDTIHLFPGTGRLRIQCDTEGVPEDASNLAARALLLFSKRSGIDQGGDIILEKKIPAGAGLGGGSSNAAAVLNGLNAYYGNPLSTKDLMETGLEIGADVPFFISGRPAIVTGIGEKVEPVAAIKQYKVLVVWPGVGLSTREVYKKYNLRLTNCEKKIKSRLLSAGKIDPVAYLHNDLEVPAMQLAESTGTLKRMMADSGALGSLLSGSGSAVFGLFGSGEQADAAGNYIEKNIGNTLLSPGYKVFVADMIL